MNSGQTTTDQTTCPACQQPVLRSEMIRGVCPKCASSFKTKHSRNMANGFHRATAVPITHIKSEGHYDEDSERVASTDDPESGEAFIHSFARRHGIAVETAMEIESERQDRNGNSDVDKIREFMQRIAAGISWALSYKGDAKMAFRCVALVMGFRDVAGCPGGSLVELARACSTRKHRVSRATVNKCMRSLEASVNLPQFKKLPPAPGQRSDEARRNMSIATKEGWHERGK